MRLFSTTDVIILLAIFSNVYLLCYVCMYVLPACAFLIYSQLGLLQSVDLLFLQNICASQLQSGWLLTLDNNFPFLRAVLSSDAGAVILQGI
jgi:hypothetical protein